jgi:hypothetical protein
MNSTKTIATAAALLALAHAGTAAAAELASGLTMKPLHGISFDVGAKRAVGYFLSADGQCQLVLTLAGEPDLDDPHTFTATRFEAAIPAAKATRYVSESGEALEFACAPDAQALAVTQVEHVAAAKAE